MINLLFKALDHGSFPAVCTSLVIVLILILREVRRRRVRPLSTPPKLTVQPANEDVAPSRPSIPGFRREWQARTWTTADRRILIVEDNEGTGRFLQAVASKMQDVDGRSYAAMWVLSAEEGLDALESDPPPDLLVVDLFLPGMSGMSFIEQVRTITAARPPLILVISGQGNQGALDHVARSCGADAALPKPIERVPFEQMIRLMFEAPPVR